MTLTRVARWLALSLAAGAAWIGLSAPAQAIPVFARQTGHNCQACHISYPELTAYGREFKLNGYTFGESQPVPLAVAVMAEYAKIGDNTNHADGSTICSTCNEFSLVQWSLFYGGRITDNLGVFGQASSGGFPLDSASNCCNGIAADNTEIRYVKRFSSGVGTLEDDTVVGLLLNNNPSMQDVWHSAPAWRFPWFPYNGANLGPLATTFIEGSGANGGVSGHRTVGLGAYAWYQKNWYGEVTFYRNPWGGPFSFMTYGGGTRTSVNQPSDSIDGWAPYGRFAYSRDWGYYSAEVGAFAVHAKTYYDALLRDPMQAQTFTDYGLDAQFQFNKNEPWIYSGAMSWIHEKNDLPALVLAATPQASSASHTLNEFNIKGTAYYDRTYGATLAYYNIGGTKDSALYQQGAAGGSATGSPGSAYWMLELNYVPLQDMRFSLNYQAYTKINGGSTNFDGHGNNASGQNLLQFAIWWVY